MNTVLILQGTMDPETLGQTVTALADAGLSSVIVGADEAPEGARAFPAEIVDGGTSDVLIQAARAVHAAPRDCFVLCRSSRLATAADGLGFRPVLQLGGGTLEEALDRSDPSAKHVPVAPDPETAVQYMVAEAAEHARLGPSPFNAPEPSPTAAEDLPSRADLQRVLALVVLAGTAIALALAYFLQEIYKSFHFPPIVYWLTLQFMPEWGRGVIFLLVGAAIGAVASRALTGANPLRPRGR